ncbi:TlyA family RNA methyltransferase [Mesorhizobium sp. CAU 1732]|uniref:TlyA family RNA methyltransferase n=1 Tax=Mesorhizobium sp. CAU 1732 TaxID=3140358 RepID=UPI0032617067
MNEAAPKTGRPRLDELLVQRGLFASRSRARDAIARGTVTVDGRPVAKPGQPTAGTAEIEVSDPAQSYVSRAALKLKAGLEQFGFDPADRDALDIGASTGGFTQVLLERGARHVTALDVGHGQLDAKLAADPRVTSLEKLNARDLTRDHLGGARPDFIVSDVSFISLKLALPPALDLAERGAVCILLVKPQFEAGREAIGKGGLLRDPTDADRIADDLRDWLDRQSRWRAIGVTPSPIEGGDGNREFLLGGMKDQ